MSKSPEKNQQILRAAITLFSRAHDINKVSMEDIAQEAHVSPTTIYNYFGTREMLLLAIVKELTQQTVERNRAFIRSDIPFPEKLISVMSTKVELMGQVNNEVIDKMMSQDSKVGQYFNEIYEHEIKPLWLEMVADGKKQGYIDPTLDDGILTAYLDIIKNGLSIRPVLLKDMKENIASLKQLLHIWLYGFMIKEIDLFRKEE
jgi:AcrR family transcriptional regulator